MSSLRNSLHRRNHKERSQLTNRTRLGILEKHQDYVLRARDYHSKQDRIQRLLEKAAQRNKDEFYFGMNGEKTVSGVVIRDRGNVGMPVDLVKVLKSQDENYIRTQRAKDLKRIDQLKTQIATLVDLVADSSSWERLSTDLDEKTFEILQDSGILPGAKRKGRKNYLAKPKHVFFETEGSHNVDHASSSTPVLSSSLQSPVALVEDLGWSDVTGSLTLSPQPTSNDKPKESVESWQHRLDLLRELADRSERQKLLRYCERELEMQRLLMAKGARQKLHSKELAQGNEREEVDEDELESRKTIKNSSSAPLERAYQPRVYKWRRQRQK